MKKIVKAILITALAALCLTACGGEKGGGNELEPKEPSKKLTENTIEATIELDTGDEIVLELYPDLAPETVENFVDLAEDGFYDGTIFHRVIEDFVIQGGGYDENLREQKADTITGEFEENGFKNDLSHTRGVISMARLGTDYDSASSQFFIVVQDALHLDGKYAAFGRVVEGLDVVDDIASVRTAEVASSGMQDVPTEPIIIDTITIDDSGASASGDKDKDKESSSKRDKDDDKTSSSSRDEDDEDEDRTSGSSSSSTNRANSGTSGSSSGLPGSSGSGNTSQSGTDEEDDEPIAGSSSYYNPGSSSGGSSSTSGGSSSNSSSSSDDFDSLDEDAIRALLEGADDSAL